MVQPDVREKDAILPPASFLSQDFTFPGGRGLKWRAHLRRSLIDCYYSRCDDIWGFPKISRGPNKQDYSILGSIIGSPYFGKLPFIAMTSAHTMTASCATAATNNSFLLRLLLLRL